MKPIANKYLSIFNSVSVDSSLWILYTCFAELTFTFEKIPLVEIDTWIENNKSQHIKNLWVEQRKLKYPSMIFLDLMLDKKDRTLHERMYTRVNCEAEKVKNLSYEERVEIVKLLKQDLMHLTTFDCVEFLGEEIGAWMLTCPETIVRQNIDKTKNWRPTLAWLRTTYPESLGNDIPTEELELLFILDYYVYYTFETIMSHNTV